MSRFKNEIEVESVSLHQSVVIAGVQSDKTITKAKNNKIKSMVLTEHGLLIVTGEGEYIIPSPAIGSCMLAKEKPKKQ